MWFADGSNYPGTPTSAQRKRWFEEGLRASHAALAPNQRLLVEYKPFEPAFYHTDIADWGMALLLARAAGPQAKVLVDTGHHYPAQNIEQIVAWLLSENMLGGFHFNDRRYADDDLTLGSIDPYQVFRIFHEILFFEWETGSRADIAYMIDQSHNLKGKIEAMIQTVTMAQELFAKAALVDHTSLAEAQKEPDIVAAESCLQDAFATDVRPAIQRVAASKGCPQTRCAPFARAAISSASRKSAARRTCHSHRLRLSHARAVIWPSTLAPKAGGRCSGRLHAGVLTTEDVHRFPNEPVEYGGSLHWDVRPALVRNTPRA